MKPDLRQKVRDFIREQELVSPGDRVAVAVSGGADSLTLLHVLLSLKEELALSEVTAIHINHGLRGEEADRDEAVVCERCQQWQVPLYTYHMDVAKEAAGMHTGLEETGRRMRYACFREWQDNGFLVATGHTRSDVAETVLMHLTRGSGLGGLAGISPKRDRIIRPLLTCAREETEQYCRDSGIVYVQDSSNADVRFARNRMRHRVLPELRQINPQIEEVLGRLADHVRADEEFLRNQAVAWLDKARTKEGMINRTVLREAPPVLALRALRLHFPEYDMEATHWRALLTLLTEEGAITLPGDRQVCASGDWLFEKKKVPLPKAFCFPLAAGETVMVDETLYHIEKLPVEEFFRLQKIHKKLFSFSCSYDIIKNDLYARQRQNGDAYHPAGRGGKTLKKMMQEAGLTARERASLPVVCDGEGILLVPGFGCDERGRITEQTRQVLLVCPDQFWRELKGESCV